MARVAFYTFGILRETPGHPQVQGFFDRIHANFGAAEQSVGFIDRSRLDPETGLYSWGEWVSPRFFREEVHAENPKTLSVWRDLESIFAFAYSGEHLEVLKRREEWFIKPDWPPYVAWWVSDDYLPNWEEGKKHIEYLHDFGPSGYAFDFKVAFDAKGRNVEVNKSLVKKKIARNLAQQKIINEK